METILIRKVLKKLKGNLQLVIADIVFHRDNTLEKHSAFFFDTNAGGIGVAHNGNLTNSILLRNKLVEGLFTQLQIQRL